MAKTSRHSFYYETEEEFLENFIEVKSVLDLANADILWMHEYKDVNGTVCSIVYRYEERSHDTIKFTELPCREQV